MAIKKYIANADNTISNAWQSNLTRRATGSNMGAADVLELILYTLAHIPHLQKINKLSYREF